LRDFACEKKKKKNVINYNKIFHFSSACKKKQRKSSSIKSMPTVPLRTWTIMLAERAPNGTQL
jgi:hypothetical protein